MRTLRLREPGDPALRIELTHGRAIDVDRDLGDNALVHVLAATASAIVGQNLPEGLAKFANLVEVGGWAAIGKMVDLEFANSRSRSPFLAVFDLVGMHYEARVTVSLPLGEVGDAWMALVEAIGRLAEHHDMRPESLLRAIALDPPRGQVAIVGDGIPESAPTGAREGISIPVPSAFFPTKGGDA